MHGGASQPHLAPGRLAVRRPVLTFDSRACRSRQRAGTWYFRARRLTLSLLLQIGEQPDLSGRSQQGIVESIAIEVAGLADPDLGG